MDFLELPDGTLFAMTGRYGSGYMKITDDPDALRKLDAIWALDNSLTRLERSLANSENVAPGSNELLGKREALMSLLERYRLENIECAFEWD